MRTEGYFYFFVSLIFLLLNSSLSWRPYRYQVLNVTAISFTAKAVVNATQISENEISFFINLKETMPDLFVRTEFYMDSGDGFFDLKYVNETFDVCRFLRDKKYLPFVQIFYRFIVDQANFPTSCPVKKNIYGADKISANVEKFPPVFPARKFYIGAFFYMKKGKTMEPLGFFKEYAQITKIYN